MPLRFCDHVRCPAPAERVDGSCIICSFHYCSIHRNHSCPSQATDPDAYFIAYDKARKKCLIHHLTRINSLALSKLASSLRNGIACTIPALLESNLPNYEIASAQTGGQNCNLDIVFEDGVTWLARTRLDDPSLPPPEVQRVIFESEVATLKWLNTIGAPVPRVFHAEVAGHNNPVGVSFILMEKMTGTPFEWDDATPEQKSKVMQQLVDIFILLEQHPFVSAGSMRQGGSSEVKIGPFAQTQLFASDTETLGPFTALREYLSGMIAMQKQMVLTGELSAYPVDVYLSHLWRDSTLDKVTASCTDTGIDIDTRAAPKFYLKHNDDKGDHILVDASHNITALIDWEFASTEPKHYAFSSPCMMWPVADFYSGSNNLAPEELEFATMFDAKGRSDLGDCVRNGRKMQRFMYLALLPGAPTSVEEWVGMFQGERQAWSGDGDGDGGGVVVEDYETWKAAALERSKLDRGLQTLLSRER